MLHSMLLSLRLQLCLLLLRCGLSLPPLLVLLCHLPALSAHPVHTLLEQQQLELAALLLVHVQHGFPATLAAAETAASLSLAWLGAVL
jgi:uncharacterized membrane protein